MHACRIIVRLIIAGEDRRKLLNLLSAVLTGVINVHRRLVLTDSNVTRSVIAQIFICIRKLSDCIHIVYTLFCCGTGLRLDCVFLPVVCVQSQRQSAITTGARVTEGWWAPQCLVPSVCRGTQTCFMMSSMLAQWLHRPSEASGSTPTAGVCQIVVASQQRKANSHLYFQDSLLAYSYTWIAIRSLTN